jgi:hypothetical protein
MNSVLSILRKRSLYLSSKQLNLLLICLEVEVAVDLLFLEEEPVYIQPVVAAEEEVEVDSQCKLLFNSSQCPCLLVLRRCL